jgi:hypothetical protein
VQDSLVDFVYRVLLRRCLFGWSPRHDVLMSLPPSTVVWQLNECLGHDDISEFEAA